MFSYLHDLMHLRINLEYQKVYCGSKPLLFTSTSGSVAWAPTRSGGILLSLLTSSPSSDLLLPLPSTSIAKPFLFFFSFKLHSSISLRSAHPLSGFSLPLSIFCFFRHSLSLLSSKWNWQPWRFWHTQATGSWVQRPKRGRGELWEKGRPCSFMLLQIKSPELIWYLLAFVWGCLQPFRLLTSLEWFVVVSG